MVHLVVQISKYVMIFLMLIYTFECFYVFRYQKTEEERKAVFHIQRMLIFFLHFDAYLVLYLTTENFEIVAFYLSQLMLFATIILIYRMCYKASSDLLLNNMVLLMGIGLIMLTRLSYGKAIRQFIFMIAGTLIALIIPVILKKLSLFRRLTWLYAVIGIGLLGVVAVCGQTSYGAKLSISIGGISLQPSEFVKIIFVFYIAGMLFEKHDLKQLLITSICSAVFVLMLVASKDLGGALLYFITYLVMIYVATKKFYYFAGGFGLLAVAFFVGSKLFTHVGTRIIAWKDPLSVIDNQGYQVCQSLFGIGTGGWFGLGLNQGRPKKIPVVENDFIFAAISEEMGAVFALCLIMVCISCFFMIMNIAMKLKDNFYKLVAVGLATLYAMQVFLTIGGVIKFIPSTGVTLPLVSYGGSSLLSTMIVFGVIQGLYIREASSKGGEHGKEKTVE